jgi:regulator of CtrA degradation
MNNDKRDIRAESTTTIDPVSFAEKMAGSGNFQGLFRDGMSLLEETADYLDGPGRAESRELGRLGGLAYATESMKLTTRLMQLASWLLLQRAVNEGEMSMKQAAEEKNKVRLEHPEDQQQTAGFEELPFGLTDLIERSLRLQARVRYLDEQLRGVAGPVENDDHPVFSQHDLLRSAFSKDS